MARSGGKYEIRDGEPVLVERTGWKPPKSNKAPKKAPKPAKKED